MSTVLYNPIVVNPLAYLVFPGLYELIPNTTDYIEYCTYTGILEIHIDNLLVKLYEHTDSIDLSEFINSQIRISLVTGLGSVLLGEWIIDESRIAIPESIRKNLVVWYDVAKQNATNESMQANPVLKDFSGNGHDATCYNFAWSKNSGIGMYGDRDFSNANASDKSVATVIKESNTKLRLTTTELIADNAFYNLISFYRFNNNTYTTEWRIKVAGLKENQGIRLFIHNNIGVPAYVLDNDGSVNEQGIILSDGTYLIKPALNANTPDTATAEFYATSFPAYKTKSYDVTIELLPQYPNALVSDGVDDYCLVEGLPILTKEKGYTVIAKRKLFYKENTLQVLASTGAFILERQENTSLKNTYNFGSVNTVTYPEEITYQTSKSFNGTSLNVGDSAGTDSLKIFTHIDDYASIALYSLLLFNRDLTDEEIEWVKTNLIEQ